MRGNLRVQKIWLRVLGAKGPGVVPRIERVEEGHYAVVCEAAGRGECWGAGERADFDAVKPLIPHFSRTRAVYLNRRGAYGLSGTDGWQDWAGPLGEQVSGGGRHAFAIVDTEIFAREVSALLRASGWKVERVQDNLRVSDGRYSECVNLLRAIVQMVLARSTFAEAARWLRSQLAARFRRDAQLFARFQCEPGNMNLEAIHD